MSERLLMFSLQSLGWLLELLEWPLSARTERLEQWRDMTGSMYTEEAAPAARRIVRTVGRIADAFPAWTRADITRLVTEVPSLADDRSASRYVDRLVMASGVMVAARQPHLRQQLDPVQQEELRLHGAHATVVDDIASPDACGALTPGYLAAIVATLRMPNRATCGARQWPEPISVDAGLTDAESAAVEARGGFEFPPDLRSLLQYALPVGRGFPNWRIERGEERERAETNLAWAEYPSGGHLGQVWRHLHLDILEFWTAFAMEVFANPNLLSESQGRTSTFIPTRRTASMASGTDHSRCCTRAQHAVNTVSGGTSV